MSTESRREYVEMMLEDMSVSGWIYQLALDGYIEICPICGQLSAYSWDDVDEDEEIEHIPACSGLGEWQCGHCRAYLCDVDSSLADWTD